MASELLARRSFVKNLAEQCLHWMLSLPQSWTVSDIQQSGCVNVNHSCFVESSVSYLSGTMALHPDTLSSHAFEMFGRALPWTLLETSVPNPGYATDAYIDTVQSNGVLHNYGLTDPTADVCWC